MGTAVGFLVPPVVLTNSFDIDFLQYRLGVLMYGGAALTTALFLLVLILFKERPPVPPSQAQLAAVVSASQQDYLLSLKRLLFNKGFLLLIITYGMNTGSYYEICTLLNPIVLHYFPGETLNAGRIGLTLILSGLVGAILAGIWLDRTKYYKATTVFIYLMSVGCLVAFTFTLGLQLIWIVFICVGLIGFFMTGYLPVGFEFAAELTFPESEGTSSGLLNASAQIFGILLVIAIRAMIANVPNGMWAGNLTISAIVLLGGVLTVLIPANLRRQNAQHKTTDQEQTISKPNATNASICDSGNAVQLSKWTPIQACP